MAGFNGLGVYTNLYNWVQDAVNGIKILASKQDQQWAVVATAFNNCLTRDAQGKPTANFDLAGFKAINAGAATLATDLVQLQQINANLSEFITDSVVPVFVGIASFKFVGVDKSATYKVGRRIKIVHNGGATTSNYYITAVVVGADTTVSVNSASLVAALVSAAYSTQDPTQYSLPGITYVVANKAALQAVAGATLTVVAFDTNTFDELSEFASGTGKVTAKLAGAYHVNFWSGVSVAQAYTVSCRVAGALTQVPAIILPGVTTSDIFASFVVPVLAGQTIDIRIQATGAFNLGGGTGTLPNWTVTRVGPTFP